MAFEFDDLPAAIRRGWDAIVPPIAELLAALSTVVYVAGSRELAQLSAISWSNLSLLPPQNIRDAITFYKLSAVAPLAAVIIVLVTAHATGRILRWIGRIVPGHLVVNTTNLFYVSVDKPTMGRLWVCHPDLDTRNGLNTLSTIIEEQVAIAADDPKGHPRLRGLRNAEMRSNRYSDRITFAKGLVILAIFAWLVTPDLTPHSTRPTGRLIIAVLATASWIFINTCLYVSATHRLMRTKIDSYLMVCSARLPNGGEPTQDDWVRTHKRWNSIKEWQLNDNPWTFSLCLPVLKVNSQKLVSGAVIASAKKAYRRLQTIISGGETTSKG